MSSSILDILYYIVKADGSVLPDATIRGSESHVALRITELQVSISSLLLNLNLSNSKGLGVFFTGTLKGDVGVIVVLIGGPESSAASLSSGILSDRLSSRVSYRIFPAIHPVTRIVCTVSGYHILFNLSPIPLVKYLEDRGPMVPV